MKTTLLLVLCLLSAGGNLSSAQTAMTSPALANLPTSTSKPIPEYLVYRHFLAWANHLNTKAIAAGESDPYTFAEPFQNAHLETADLDAVLRGAKALDSDLRKYGENLKAAVAKYRSAAQKAADSTLPPAPAEIHQLEAIRTAILVQHMVSLQSALGLQKSELLDAYLKREFVPHMSLKLLARPAASTASSIPTQALGQQ